MVRVSSQPTQHSGAVLGGLGHLCGQVGKLIVSKNQTLAGVR